MTTIDYFEIFYWLVSLLILGVTVYWIKTSPVKAVEIGRKLDNEQNKYNAKRDLFLTLFSLRGNPTHYDFVSGLNQIDIVFQDDQKVLTAWTNLYNSLNQNNQVNQLETWERLRTDLLSEMAQVLGYNSLKQTDIQKHYAPQAHLIWQTDNQSFHQSAKEYYQSGSVMHNYVIKSFQDQLKTGNDEKDLSDNQAENGI
ncbi:MAG: hypothetical protein JST95_06510 [Bacteroidetes bacterium]|nr:hypothetical protein [Bacteroidota bacterium]